MKTLKIAIADDHPIILRGISSLIMTEPACELLFTATGKNDLLGHLKNQEPDLLVLDVVMPGVSATELFGEIKDLYPSLMMIAYTSLSSDILVRSLFRDGVKGYVNKNDPPEELITAINTLREGGIYLPEQYGHLAAKLSDTEALAISKREKEILLLISEQFTTTQIAEKLFISVNTVESHRKKLFEKFKVENLAGLIREAIKQGYIH